MGEERKLYKVLVRKSEGKGHLRRPNRRWQDGIRMDLRGCKVAQDRGRCWAVLNTVMNLRVLAPRII
jgi:hypothetical protein